MADQAGEQPGEMVFCHQCQHQWMREPQGLTCPECGGEFTEIIEPDSDPRQVHEEEAAFPEAATPPLHHHLHTHNPWADDGDEPDGSNGTRHFTQTRLPGGGMQVSFTTYGSSSPRVAGRGASQQSPVMDDFQRMIMDMTGGGPAPMMGRRPMSPFRPRSASPAMRARSPHSPPYQDGFDGMFGFPPAAPLAPRPGEARTAFNTTERLWPRDANNPQPHAHPVGDLQGLLQMLVQNLGGMAGPGGPHQREGSEGAAHPTHPFSAIFTSLLNPAAASHGDAVYTQEALDRVISQLMEQNPSSNAPGPASEAAIAALPKKKVDESLLGEEGKAECSVCMDEVRLGEEVTTLPCGHWFHEQCSTMWLQEHDTCPICRTGIMPKQGDGNRPRDPRQQPLNAEPYRRAADGDARRMPGGFGQTLNPGGYANLGREPSRSPFTPPPPPGSSHYSSLSAPRRHSRSEDRRSSRGSGDSGSTSGIGSRVRGWFGGSNGGGGGGGGGTGGGSA